MGTVNIVHDMTMSIPRVVMQRRWPEDAPFCQRVIDTHQWRISAAGAQYDARVHFFNHWGMVGTYIDFPGHVAETDDGRDAASIAVESLFRVPGQVIHLDRADGSGSISSRELQDALGAARVRGRSLVINALGDRRCDEIEDRSVYLSREAVAWIAQSDVELLVSDVYESNDDPQYVFPDLFTAGISTVCCPERLAGIAGPDVWVTALPLRVQSAVQLPCRLIIEETPHE